MLVIDRNTGKGRWNSIRENKLFILQLYNTRLQKKLQYKWQKVEFRRLLRDWCVQLPHFADKATVIPQAPALKRILYLV